MIVQKHLASVCNLIKLVLMIKETWCTSHFFFAFQELTRLPIPLEYYLEDVIEMLGFVPPLSEKKKRRDKDDTVEEEEVSWSARAYVITRASPSSLIYPRMCITIQMLGR